MIYRYKIQDPPRPSSSNRQSFAYQTWDLGKSDPPSQEILGKQGCSGISWYVSISAICIDLYQAQHQAQLLILPPSSWSFVN